jgi:hypothetical protein
MCGCAVGGVRFWHSDDHFTLVSGQKRNQVFSINATNRERKRRKHPSEHRLAIIGIRNAAVKGEANAPDVKRGTLSDDESYVVRQGTEPKLLIA